MSLRDLIFGKDPRDSEILFLRALVSDLQQKLINIADPELHKRLAIAERLTTTPPPKVAPEDRERDDAPSQRSRGRVFSASLLRNDLEDRLTEADEAGVRASMALHKKAMMANSVTPDPDDDRTPEEVEADFEAAG